MTLYTYTEGFGGASNSNMSLTAGTPGLRLKALHLSNDTGSSAFVRLIRAVGSLTGGNVSSNLDTYHDGDLPSTPAAVGLYGNISYSGATPYYLAQWTLTSGTALVVDLPEPMRLTAGNSLVVESPFCTVNLFFEE